MEMAPNVTCLAEMVLKLWKRQHLLRFKLTAATAIKHQNSTTDRLQISELLQIKKVTSVVCLSLTNVLIKISS